MARLLLVEDHVLVRQSIRAFLQEAAFEVVGEASTGQEAVQMALNLRPHLVIMDLHLPDMNGIDATRAIRHACPAIRVVGLTAYHEKAYQRALYAAGADGLVLKTAEFAELLAVITQALAHQGGDVWDAEPSPTQLLTKREVDVLACAARGWPNKQIAAELQISDRTVQVHLQAVYQKLGVSNRTEAVLRALALGIIPHSLTKVGS